MALSITKIDSASGNGSTLVSNTIAPSDNCMLLVIFSQADADNNDVVISISSTFSTSVEAWTQHAEETSPNPGISIWRAQCGSSPGSGTITVTAGDINRSAMIVLEVTGYDTTTPIPQATITKRLTSTSGNVTLSSSVSPGNYVLGSMAIHDPDGVKPTYDSNFTELWWHQSGGATNAGVQVLIDSSTLPISCSWFTIPGLPDSIIAITEIAAAPPPESGIISVAGVDFANINYIANISGSNIEVLSTITFSA